MAREKKPTRTEFQQATTKALAGIKRSDPETAVQIVAAESLAEVADRARAALDDRLLLSVSRQLSDAVKALRSGSTPTSSSVEEPDPLAAALQAEPTGAKTKRAKTKGSQ